MNLLEYFDQENKENKEENKEIKIDLVYTYVDGNDENFIIKKNKYLSKNDTIYNPDIRFNNINEIYYSVNNAIKYLPWINKIYIITDNQIPPIDKSLIETKKVIIIDHTEIIPSKYLPTFFSDVIESYIHNIPNLSDIFLYNNDDTFNMDYISIEDILENNKLDGFKFKIINNYNEKIIQTKISEYAKRLLITQDVLNNYFKNSMQSNQINNYKFINNHHTKILNKSTLKFIELLFENELTIMRKNKFRNDTCIQYLFLAINLHNYYNKDIIINNSKNYKEYHFGNMDYSDKLINKFNKNIKYKFLCLNNMNYTYKDVFIKYITS